MPINASPHYLKAEREYLEAQTTNQKIMSLKKMISLAPSHKGAENLRKELKRRLARLKYVGEKEAKKAKGIKGIKKEGFQVSLVGFTNSGKSSLLKAMTNARPVVGEHEFTTFEPVVGTMDYDGVRAQMVDLPSLNGKHFDYNIANSTDLILIVVCDFDDIEKAKAEIPRARSEKIVVFNKSDLLNEHDLRRVEARLKSKKYDFVLVSSSTGEGILDLKEKIFSKMGVMRIYMKEPGKKESDKPAVLKKGSDLKDLAESIYKGFSKQVKETRLTGPSGKFSNQRVGLKHRLKDRDVVEFHTR